MAKSKTSSAPERSEPENLSFENALLRLEEITELLESGEQGLDDSLRLYTEGIELARRCNQQLSMAEEKVAKLLAADGTLSAFIDSDSKSAGSE